MDTRIRDWGQLAVWLVTMVGAAVAVWRTLVETRLNREQRAKELEETASELRWRRANASRELMGEIHGHELAKHAIMMMDWREGEHDYAVKGRPETISYSDVRVAMQKPSSAVMTEKDEYIRDCFDWFLYYLDRIEHYIRIGLIDFGDVASPFKPYARIIASQADVFSAFLKTHFYELVQPFVERYGGAL